MTSSALIRCVYDGEAFRPASRFFAARAAEAFGAGEVVMLNVEEERSMRSHRHYFACIKDAWNNLPEAAAFETWAQSPEHLRKYALIRTGYCDGEDCVCHSPAEALRFAAFMRPAAGYSIVVARGNIVTRYTAHSQSVKAMGQKAFQKSKTDVLDFLAGLIGAEASQLGSAA